MSMQLGDIIHHRRAELNISRPDLTQRLRTRGYELPPATLQYWEDEKRQPSGKYWNPSFMRALAEALEMTEVELLAQLGFQVGPPGDMPPFALVFAQKIAQLSETLSPQELDEALDRLNAVFKAAGF